MKNQEIDAPVSVLRRKLMLGLPSGFALATPLAMLGCGGGGGDDNSTEPAVSDEDAALAALIAKMPVFERSAAKVAVSLPAGSSVALEKTNLFTANNVSQVAADGTAGAVLLGGAPQMAYLFDAAGRLLLLGVIEPGTNDRLNSRTSAEALVLLASEAALEGEAIELAVREVLRTHSIVEPVRLAVEAALARSGIDERDEALMAAIGTAVRALLGTPPAAASARERAQAVKVWPEGEQSGVTVELTSDYNTVLLRNSFRRRAHAWVAHTGDFDASGKFVALPAPAKVKDFPITGTTALSFDNLVIAVGDYVAQMLVDVGFLGAYKRGNDWWSPVKSAPIELSVAAGAEVSVYRTRVVGVGASDGLPRTDEENTKLQEIIGETFWEDICLPFLKNVVLPMASWKLKDANKAEFKNLTKELMLALTGDMFKSEVSGKLFPAALEALRRGDAREVIDQFWKEFYTSSTWKKLFETALKAEIQGTGVSILPLLMNDNGMVMKVNLLGDQKLIDSYVKTLSDGLTKVARVIAVIKLITTAGDYIAMAKDWSGSANLDEFTLNVSKATITLTPDPVAVSYLAGTAGKGAVTAQVEGLSGAFTPANVFLQWECSGRYGNLFRRGGEGTNEFESPLSNPTHDYFPSQESDDPDTPDTIKVTAFYRNVTTNARVEMGSVTVPVKFKKEFNLSITPASGTDVPTDTDMPVTAFFDEKLPAGTTVDWAWSMAGAGSLAANAPDANPKDSTVTFKSPSAEGSARVTVRATLNLPASATTPARTVVADPVSTTLNVKKGLKTITMEVRGGIFGCTDPLACGVTEYTAYIVPRFPGVDTTYSAVLSGFAYGSCNRVESWSNKGGPVPDRRGCAFPITYYPHSSAGQTNQWAVWAGFGGELTGSNKCVVTITLKP